MKSGELYISLKHSIPY